ncbi:hypothetical protein [Chryseolinea soli]|uniref:Uncharacterized protein n=1 Tax=Chryseolinea soli TaxID=2321403 RepID=A0A385SKS1_9BACT|nr:hypothetical protein [Chryseolinea soli]AYB30971.1 hypothetical protein D4L85_10440 [Chryseolinea soli]
MKTFTLLRRLRFAAIVFLCALNFSFASGIQSLLIPKIDAPVKAKNGIIELPAFCADISKTWANDGTILETIFWGGSETAVHLIIAGQSKTLTLSSLSKQIKIVAATRSILIKTLSKSIRLVSIESNGFMVGNKANLPYITRDQYLASLNSFNDPNYNINSQYHSMYQQLLWKIIYNAERANEPIKIKRLTEIAEKNFANKDLEIRILGSDKIELVDKGKNIKLIQDFYTYQNVNIYNLKRLQLDEGDSWEICLNFDPADSSLISFSMSGKYENVVPIEIVYSSTNQIRLSSYIKKEIELKPGIDIECGIAIEVDPKEGEIKADSPFQKCDVKASGNVCSQEGVQLEVEVCGIKLNLNLTQIFFND